MRIRKKKKTFLLLENLPSEDLRILAKLLSLPPDQNISPAWLTGQKARISTFPRSLQAPRAILYRLSSCSSSHKALLCPSHKALHGHVIHEIFLEITTECTTRLRQLHEQHGRLPAKISAFLQRMQRVNSLWMSPEAYFAKFPDFTDGDVYGNIPSNCEACIVAAIGGNRNILCDLLACMLGRKKKHRQQPPPLMRIVREWLHSVGDCDEIVKAAEKLGRRICAYRKEMQKVRRAQRRAVSLHKKGIEPQDKCEPGKEIVDFYADYLTDSALDMHTHSEHVRHTHPLIPDPNVKNGVTYTESVYDGSNLGGPAAGSTIGAPGGELAVEYATTYMKLVGGEEVCENKDEDVGHRETVKEYIGRRAGWK